MRLNASVLPETQAFTNGPRHILYVDHTAKLGGGEIALLNLVRTLDKRRFVPIVVLSSDGPLRAKLTEAGVETHVLPLDIDVLETRKDSLGLRSLLQLQQVWQTLRYTGRLARLMRTMPVDVVHTNSLKSDIMGGMAARLAGIPVLWHVRDRIDEDYLPRMVVGVFRWLCCWVPDYVVANSKATLQTISLLRNDRCATIYSGVEIDGRLRVVHDGVQDAHRPARQAHPSDGTLRIGLVGRLSPWKGQHIFIQAAAQVHAYHPHVQFDIIGSAMFGEEAYEAECRALVTSLNLEEHVHFLGFCSDTSELIAEMEVLVHASTTGEPFGQVVVEGMVAGKPVVATNGGGVPEIVVDGVTGLLVPMGDADALAAAIMELLADPQRAQEMGRCGRQRVREHFTIEMTARKMESVYDEIARLKPRRSGVHRGTAPYYGVK